MIVSLFPRNSGITAKMDGIKVYHYNTNTITFLLLLSRNGGKIPGNFLESCLQWFELVVTKKLSINFCIDVKRLLRMPVFVFSTVSK